MKKTLSLLTFLIFLITSLTAGCPLYASEGFLLPKPGAMIGLSPAFEPLLIKGLKIHPENPFRLDFILDQGDYSQKHMSSPNASVGDPQQEQLKIESTKLIKYFLASFTIPEKNLWVNLSPYEKNRIISSDLGQTEMGRDMLSQDYILKQLTASLICPEKELGKIFWEKVYAKAQKLYGTTQVPVNTFNKVWIVADQADVYEQNNMAYVVGAHLKVMLEEDYLALYKGTKYIGNNTHTLGSQVVREVILPQIENEVNRGRNFFPLRQMFYSMILASWYKIALKDTILPQIYGNQSKVKVGINQGDPKANEEIYKQYLRAYKKGVFNYIKDELDPVNQQVIPRKYFSGGALVWGNLGHAREVSVVPASTRLPNKAMIVSVDMSPQFRSPSNEAMVTGYDPLKDELIAGSALADGMTALGKTVEIRREFIQNLGNLVGAAELQSNETELAYQVRILVEALKRLGQLEKILRSRPLTVDSYDSSEEMKQYKLIQYAILKQREAIDFGLPVVSNFRGTVFDVYHYKDAGYVKKVVKYPENIRGLLEHMTSNGKKLPKDIASFLWNNQWRFYYKNAKLIETRLEKLAARVIQMDERTFYQIRRPPLREVLTELLSNLSKNAIVKFNKPLREITPEELLTMDEYQSILRLIDAWCNLQRSIWSRGVVDTDPKILDNYGVYFKASSDENPIRLLDFSHVTNQREQFWAEWNEYQGVMFYWNYENADMLNNLAEQFGLPTQIGEYYFKNAPTEDGFKKAWPDGQEPINIKNAKRQGPVIGKRLLKLYKELTGNHAMISTISQEMMKDAEFFHSHDVYESLAVALARWDYMPYGQRSHYSWEESLDEPKWLLKKDGQIQKGSHLMLSIEEDKQIVNFTIIQIAQSENQGKGIVLETLKLIRDVIPVGWEIHINSVDHRQTLYALLKQIVEQVPALTSVDTIRLWKKVKISAISIDDGVTSTKILRLLYDYDQYQKSHPKSNLKPLLGLARETRFLKDLHVAGFNNLQIVFSNPWTMDIIATKPYSNNSLTANGGIDLNASHMHFNINKNRANLNFRVDPAMIKRIKREGFNGLKFEIKSIRPFFDLSELLGLKSSLNDRQMTVGV